jgi:hypothetical protein
VRNARRREEGKKNASFGERNLHTGCGAWNARRERRLEGKEELEEESFSGQWKMRSFNERMWDIVVVPNRRIGKARIKTHNNLNEMDVE